MIGEDGAVLAGARGDDGEIVLDDARALASMTEAPDWTRVEELNTTLVCVLTDAPLDKPGCSRVARMASGGVARAVDPVFSSVDGDVAFCLASGELAGPADRFVSVAVGALAATVTAAAIRDAVRGPIGAIGSARVAIDEFILRRFEEPGRGARVPARALRADRGRRDDARPGDLRAGLALERARRLARPTSAARSSTSGS